MYIRKSIISFFALVLTGYLLLVAVYALPTAPMKRNVRESYELFRSEGAYRQLIKDWRSSQLDNFTDALILLNAESENQKSVWLEALDVKRQTAGSQSPVEDLVSIHSGENLNYTTASYARYWHGYLTYVKPLLMVFNYQQIRFVLMFIQIGLLFTVLYMMAIRNKVHYFLPLFLTYFFLNPLATALSLQFTPVYVLTMIEFIVILLFEDKYRQSKQLWFYHFFIVGCLTVYFDFLTYPIVTLGLPIIFLLSLYTDDLKDGMRGLFGSGISWGIGYSAMWSSKWIIATAVTGQNVFAQASDGIGMRMSFAKGDKVFGLLDVLRRNIDPNAFALQIILLLFFIFIIISFARKTFRADTRYIPIAGAALLPLVWYAALPNHSYIHSFMTYRDLSIFVFAISTIGMMALTGNKTIEKK